MFASTDNQAGRRALCVFAAVAISVFLVLSLTVLPGTEGEVEAASRSGGSWVEPELVLEGNTRTGSAGTVVISGKTLHLVYLQRDNFSDNALIGLDYYYTNRSVDGGSWSEPIRIVSGEAYGIFGGGSLVAMDLAVDPSGKLHFIYSSTPSTLGNAVTGIKYTTNASGSWSTPVTISGQDNAYMGNGDVIPSIAADSAGGVYVVYAATPSGGGSSVVVREASKNGGSWSSPTTISQLGHDDCNSASIDTTGTNRYLAYDCGGGTYYAENTGAGWGTYTKVDNGEANRRQARIRVQGTNKFILYSSDSGIMHAEDVGSGWVHRGTAAGGVSPQFVADSSSNLYLVYSVGSGTLIGLSAAYARFDRATTTWGSASIIDNDYTSMAPDIAFDGTSSHVVFGHWIANLFSNLGLDLFVSGDMYYVNDSSGDWGDFEVPSNPSGLSQYEAAGACPTSSTAILATEYYGSTDAMLTQSDAGNWSDPVEVSENDPVWTASMASDSGGGEHVLYGKIPRNMDSNDLQARYTSNASGSWSEVVGVSEEETSLAGDIAVGLDDTVHFLYIDGASLNVLEYRKYENGSWTTPEVVNAGDTMGYNPKLAIDSAGNAHAAYQVFGDEGTITNRYNTNSSGTWGTPETISEGFLLAQGLNIAAGDPGEAHVLTANLNFGTWTVNLYFSSRDSSGNWTDPTNISRTDPLHWSAEPQIGVDSAGAIHVAYVARMYVPGGVDYAVRYTKNASSWSAPVTVSGSLDKVSEVRMYLEGDDPHFAISNDGSLYYSYWEEPFVSDAWYLAEGYTGDNNYPGEAFDTYALIANPTGTPTNVKATYMLPDGSTVEGYYWVPAHSRYTVHLDDVEGLENTSVSTKLVAEQNVGIVCERAMYFNYKGKEGGHNSIGTPQTSDVWYLPEGYTGNDNYPGEAFDTWVLVMNPNSSDVQIKATFMKPEGNPVEETYTVPAHGRHTIGVDDLEGLSNTSVSTKVECTSGREVVCERAMYFNYYGKEGGHDSIGAMAPATNWYMPEGYTGTSGDENDGFFTYILIQNPNDSAAEVTCSFMREDGQVIEQDLTLPANSRHTVCLNEVEGLENTSVATRVESQNGVSVICERAEYFNYYGKKGGHDSIGMPHTARSWYMAEGYTGYDNYPGEAFDTYVLIQNPSGTDTTVKATYMLTDGQTIENYYDVAANSRYTIHLNDVNGLANTSVATTIEGQNGVEIICERAMYFDYYGKQGGHSSKAYTDPL